MNWVAVSIAFFTGVIIGFLLCGFFVVIAEDRKGEDDEQRTDR